MTEMGVSPVYAGIAIILSVLAVTLSSFYVKKVVLTYRIYHDERAAVQLATGIGLLVIAIGMMVSSIGLVTAMSTLSVAGMSIARGAFLALILTLFLSHIHADPVTD